MKRFLYRQGILLLSLVLAGCSDMPRPSANTTGSNLIRSRLRINTYPNTIVGWGDSMTAGNQGVTDAGAYPTLLEAQINGRQVVNEGIGGQTSSQIGVRQGGVPSYVTVEGGSIPAQGGVTVKFATGYEPVTLPTRSIQGSIMGVEGVVTLAGFLPGGTFTFTPVAGSHTPVTVVGTPTFIPDKPYQNYLPVFWEGRNNLLKTAAGPYGPTQIEADIAAQVATLPAGSNYLVLSVLNENGPGDRKGGAGYATLMTLDNALAATYGTHYLDVRTLLVNSYNPASPVDVTDYENDMPPTSLGAIAGEGTLVNAIGTTETTFTVNLTSGTLRAYTNLVIDNESIHCLAVSGSTVSNCIRGYGGLLSSHIAGSAVTERDGTHMNKEGYAIVANAVAKKLGLP